MALPPRNRARVIIRTMKKHTDERYASWYVSKEPQHLCAAAHAWVGISVLLMHFLIYFFGSVTRGILDLGH